MDETGLKLFIGHSCATAAPSSTSQSKALLEQREDLFTTEQKSHCLVYESTKWDNENTCFTHDPILEQHNTGYDQVPLQNCSCFQIVWEVERNQNHRSMSHVAMDTEGVRSGKLEVQVPYFLAGEQNC